MDIRRPIKGINSMVGLIGLFSKMMNIAKGIIPSKKFINELKTETKGKINMCVRIFVIIPAFAEKEKPADVAP
jgi:hypothetical protein